MSATTLKKLRTPDYWEAAKKELSKRDPVMKRLITEYPGEGLTSRTDAFGTLIRAIIGQQVSVKAADAIVAKLENKIEHLSAARFLAVEQDLLREAGLSRQKILYITELSKRYLKSPFNNKTFEGMPDAEVKAFLTDFKGIGEWTAEMFLIFCLNRPDEFPIKDIGIQKAIIKQYDKPKTYSLARMVKLADNWRPYRTVATWYLWRSLDPVPVAY